MLEIHEISVTPFEQNCTILVCGETGKAAVCDCGDAAPVLARIAELGVDVELILATHGHLDHIGGTHALQAVCKVPFYFPEPDEFLREGLSEQASLYGWGPLTPPVVDFHLKDADVVTFGRVRLDVLHCPGHTPGHVVFYEAKSAKLVAGDVIFQGSVGRTDLPGGSWEELQNSIRTKVYTLPEETLIHCGHGPTTSVGREARTNPFVRK